MSKTTTAKQADILFLWDTTNANPNGDMLNDNAPRYDEFTMKALVTDVRVKRTMRDFMMMLGHDIFVREIRDKNRYVQDGKGRVADTTKDIKSGADVIGHLAKKFIDVRAFGGVFPASKESFNATGGFVVFDSLGMHKTIPMAVKGSGAFSSGAKKKNKTFREETILPYTLFGTYITVNEYNATKLNLAEDDVNMLMSALWFGTKNLLTRSKAGQMPRMMLKINYNKPGYFIGELARLVKLELNNGMEEIGIRSVDDYKVNIDKILERINGEYANAIDSIQIITDMDFKVNAPENWEKLILNF